MIPTFNYVDAWTQEAEPRFRALPDAVRELALSMEHETIRELYQDRDTLMIWPEDNGALWARFDAFDDHTLARAAHVVHAFGHWFPGSERVRDPYGLDLGPRPNPFPSGGSWKFANYATQVLHARLGLNPRQRNGGGFGFRLVDGELRRSYSSRDSWTWEVLGLATRENLASAQAVKPQPITVRVPVSEYRVRVELDSATWAAHIAAAREACGYAVDIIDAGRFLIDRDEMDRLHPAFPKRSARPAPIVTELLGVCL